MLGNIKNAISKHRDLVIGIKSKVGKKYQAQVEREEKRLVKFEKAVTKLSEKK